MLATTEGFRQEFFFSMTEEQQKKVRRGGMELMGAEKFDAFLEGKVPEQSEQDLIDKSSREFIEVNKNLDAEKDKIVGFGNIPGMTET